MLSVAARAKSSSYSADEGCEQTNDTLQLAVQNALHIDSCNTWHKAPKRHERTHLAQLLVAAPQAWMLNQVPLHRNISSWLSSNKPTPYSGSYDTALAVLSAPEYSISMSLSNCLFNSCCCLQYCVSCVGCRTNCTWASWMHADRSKCCNSIALATTIL